MRGSFQFHSEKTQAEFPRNYPAWRRPEFPAGTEKQNGNISTMLQVQNRLRFVVEHFYELLSSTCNFKSVKTVEPISPPHRGFIKLAGPTRLELATSGVTGLRSNQTELRPHSSFRTWAVEDLNLWPPACKTDALPAELTAQQSQTQTIHYFSPKVNTSHPAS